MKKLLIVKDNRTEIEYNEITRRPLTLIRPKVGDTFFIKHKLYDEMEDLRCKMLVRAKVIAITKTIQVEVF